MKIIQPIPVTSAHIVSSSIAIDDASEWTAGSYTQGQQVIYAERIYEALDTTTDVPDVGVTLDPPTWLDRGAINRLRPFDNRIGNPATSADPIVYRLRLASEFSAISLLAIKADTVRIRILSADDATVLHDETLPLTDYSPVTDWYQYFFADLDTSDTALKLGLPGFAAMDLEITIGSTPGGQYRAGEILIGTPFEVGELQWGHSYGIQDFSVRARDPNWGDWVLVQRSYSDTARFAVRIATGREHIVRRYLANLRATPALFIGADHRPGSAIYGVYEDFQTVISSPVYSQCELNISSML